MIVATWAPNAIHYKYQVAYRKTSPNNKWEWFHQETSNSYLNLTALDADTEYEVKVAGVCGENLAAYTGVILARTSASGQISNINCNTFPNTNLNTTNLINDVSGLATNNYTIMASDFIIKLTNVTSSGGTFSGDGYASVPWVGTNIKVKYTGIKINTDYKLVEGIIETVYDPNWKNILDIDKFVGAVKSLVNELFSASLGDTNFNDLLNNFRDEINKIYDEQLKSDINAILNQLLDINTQYNAAAVRLAAATTDAEKEAIKKEMQDLKNKKDELMAKLKDLQQQSVKGPKELTPEEETILKSALKKIRERYNTQKMNELKTAMTTSEQAYDAQITVQKNAHTLTVNSANAAAKVIYIGTIVNIQAGGHSIGLTYYDAERNYNRAKILRIFSKESQANTELRLLASILKVKDKPFKDYVKAQKAANVSVNQQVTETDEAVEVLCDKILLEKIYKTK